MNSAIEVSDVTKRYGSRRGIESIDLRVPANTILGFLGPNGAGKTTTIRVLLGFLRATSGRAEILGRDCWREGPHVRRETGYLPGDLRLYPWMTARSAIRLAASVRRRDRPDSSVDLLRAFDLDASVPVRKMSRGTRQKLGLLLALTHEPRVILLDEPTTALDPLVRDELYRVLRERAAAGATILFSSHTLSEVADLCERVVIVRDGRIVADESLASLRARASRHVMIRFRDATTAIEVQPPPVLTVVERAGVTWHARLAGDPAELATFLAAVEPADFTVSAPDLQDIFRSYYRTAPEQS